MKNNYHTHTTYCDGKEPMSEFVRVATESGFDQLGFSSHAPVPFKNDFGIKENKIPEYHKEIENWQQKTPVQLLAALECDFIPGMSTPFDHFRQEYDLDYIIGGVHFVRPANGDGLWFIDGPKREIYDEGLRDLFNNDIKKAVTTFWEQSFEMIETEHFEIIAHLDKIKMHNQHRFFTEEESWYKILADKALDLVKQHDIIVELNTRGLFTKRCDSFYPCDELLQKAAKLDIPFVVSSDAHQTAELNAYHDKAVERLEQFGLHIVHYEKGEWI